MTYACCMHASLIVKMLWLPWEDTAGYVRADCQHGNVLKCCATVMWGLHEIVHIGA